MKQIIDAKTILKNRDLLSLLAESVYNPTEERLHKRADKYMNNPDTAIYAAQEDDMYLGIIVLDTRDCKRIEIRDIAVSSSSQKSGVGSLLIKYCINIFHPKEIIAETDDDVGFYRKSGFEIVPLGDKYEVGIMRYQCTLKC